MEFGKENYRGEVTPLSQHAKGVFINKMITFIV